MKKTSQISTILLFIILFAFTNCRHKKTDSITYTRIDNYLSELEKVGFNGSVLVSIDGEPIISKGYGFTDIENHIANSPATVYDIGSITKQFTATAILKLEIQ